MISSPQRTVRCALLGMNASEFHVYEYCIRQYPDNAYVLADSVESAQLLLIDVESLEGRRIAYQRLSDNVSGKVPVILSANKPHTEDSLFLRKPASPETLRAILDLAAAQIGRGVSPRGQSDIHTAGAALAMEEGGRRSHSYMFRSSDASGNEMFFDPDNYLYGLVLQAIQLSEDEGGVVELQSCDQSVIRICAHSRRVYTTMQGWVLRPFATSANVEMFTMDVLGEKESVNWFAGGRTECLDGFLWRLAAWTSRGRLPQGADPNARIHLRYWPNMTRLILMPHAIQIAALWSSGAYTMAATAQILMIPQSAVHVFYCAASAIGLIETKTYAPNQTTLITQEERTAPKANDTVPQSQRGILGRILSHLMGTN